jgi:hypothetical protein
MPGTDQNTEETARVAMQEIIDDHYNTLTENEEARGASEPAGGNASSKKSILPKRPKTGRIPPPSANTVGTFTSFPPRRSDEPDAPAGRVAPPRTLKNRALAEWESVLPGSTQTEEIAIEDSDLVEIDSLDEVGERVEEWVEHAERESSQELIRMAERLDGVDPRFVRAAHALETKKRSEEVQAELQGKSEDSEGIDPKFLRAAAKTGDRAKADGRGTGNAVDDALFDGDIELEAPEEDEDDWRERLEQSNSIEIVSFLPAPVAEDPDDILDE